MTLKRFSVIDILAACMLLAYLLPSHRTTNSISFVAICHIQGAGFVSPREGRTVRTQGIVHADLDDTSRRGFFIQDIGCDGDPNTSDGLFVYLSERLDIVNPGDLVEVTGNVQEYFGLTELVSKPADVEVLSTGNSLPQPIELQPPFDNNESNSYYERLESMRVSLVEAITVGPTGIDDRSWVIRADLGIERVFHDDPRGTGEIMCVDDDGRYEISPEVKVGDKIRGLLGVQDYTGGDFCLQLFSQPIVFPKATSADNRLSGSNQAINSSPGVQGSDALLFRIASFNLNNLFDTQDDPDTEDTVLSSGEYQNRLSKRARAIHDVLGEPGIIALQEAENQEVLQALVNRPEIEADYQIITQEGPDLRGLDVAFLYRSDQAQLIEYQVHQGCTNLVDGLGPDGNLDVYNPQNLITCDTNFDGQLDGNRLFSRPPIIARFDFTSVVDQVSVSRESIGNEKILDVWVVNSHWKSKLQDSETTQYTLARRIEQAKFVCSLVDEILNQYPEAIVIVLGDLNDHPNAQPISIINQSLSNLILGLSKKERYTYNFHGLSQVLDYALVRTSLPIVPVDFKVMHINSDFPAVFESVSDTYYRSSDHDLLSLGFVELEQYTYLPLVQR